MKIQTILCPTDLSEESRGALPAALSLAKQFGAKMLLVHVVDDAFPYPDVFAWKSPDEDFYKTMRKEANEQLEKMIASADTGGVEVEKIVLLGRAHAEVVALAEDRGVDLIVLTTHGRTGLDHALMGSQAERIIRRATCPVLSIKPAPRDEG